MTQKNRLACGGRINRNKPLNFTYNGQQYQGYEGDTLASALLANGINLVGRSFKYSRPRGIIGSGAEEPNAIMQINQGAATIPNPRATQTELFDDLVARSVNGWPSTEFDLTAVLDKFSKLLPPGFYYKTFMWPKSLWMTYEKFIRKAAGLGKSSTEADPDYYDKLNHHVDLLIVGAGPAGLSAALTAAESGAHVMLIDEQAEFGGNLLASDELLDGKPATHWIVSSKAKLASMENVTLLPRTTVFSYYDHNFLAAIENRSDFSGPIAHHGSRQRIHRIRAKQVILATGAHERMAVFANNDRPGVMLASAVSTYINRYGVVPGSRLVLFTNNDNAYRTALAWFDTSREVVAIVDSRAKPSGELINQAKQKGIEVITGAAIIDVKGTKRVKAALVAPVDLENDQITGPIREIPCDLIAASSGWSPVVHLSCHTGGKPAWDAEKLAFMPIQKAGQFTAGAINANYELNSILADGVIAAINACHYAGFKAQPIPLPEAKELSIGNTEALFLVPHTKPVSHIKQFVDPQNDVTAAAIKLASLEGFESIEHIKRYTAMGFGTDQGKIGNINGVAVAAKLQGKSIAETGTTVFRPAYTPTTFGALAGRDIGELLDPVRYTPIHRWHEEYGCEWENVGQWKRAWYYPKSGEDIHAAVNRECLAVRNSVGMFDASTLGKIDVQGPDAREFLNRLYTNSYSKLAPGKCRYGLLLGEDGMISDDGVVFCLGENHFMTTTTTGGAAAVMTHMERWLQTEWPELEVYLTSVTDHTAPIAVAGPNSRKVLQKIVTDTDLSKEALPFMAWTDGKINDIPVRIFRVSFSGELAFEIAAESHYARAVWEAIFEAGQEFDITPYGTEAMHVLRAEKGFIIVGQDTDGSMTPHDMDMSWIVGNNKEFSFLGKRSLERSDTTRTDRKQWVGLLPKDSQYVLQEGAQLVEDSNQTIPMNMTGHVTSSYFSPTLNRSFALGFVKGGHSKKGQSVYAPQPDGSMIEAEITDIVFYDPQGERQHV